MLAKSEFRCRYTGRILHPPETSASFAEVQHRAMQQRSAQAADRQFFVLTTEPNMERKAAAHLTGRGFKALVPEMLGKTTRGIRRVKVQRRRPIFPGYLFILWSFELDRGRRHVIDNAVGIHRFLRLGEDYAIVPIAAMQRIVDIEEELLRPKKISGPAAIFAPGETVRVAEGPFSGFTAEIETLDDGERITVLLSLLQRVVRTQLDAEQVEKL